MIDYFKRNGPLSKNSKKSRYLQKGDLVIDGSAKRLRQPVIILYAGSTGLGSYMRNFC